MIKIGITGGIGSGKSVVAELFRLYQIPVFDADKEAKILNDTSPVIRKKLTQLFGDDVYEESRLNRKKLAEIIFSDKTNLRKTNAIIHPELARHFIEWTRQRNQYPIVAIDAAILFEAGFDKLTDKTIAVYAPEELRISRAMKRDNTSRTSIESRIKHQMPDEEKVKLADFTIYNDSKLSVLTQFHDILQVIRNLHEQSV